MPARAKYPVGVLTVRPEKESTDWSKDALKERRYRWNPGTDGRPRAWYKELPAEQRDPELEWLSANVYAGATPRLRQDLLDARSRYSDRV